MLMTRGFLDIIANLLKFRGFLYKLCYNTTEGFAMTMKKWIFIGLIVYAVLVTGWLFYYRSPALQNAAAKRASKQQQQKLEAQEKQLLAGALEYLDSIKKAVASYATQQVNPPQSDILLQEMLKLSEIELPKGRWDNTLGVYFTPHFIFIGNCYSIWCYVDVTRKGNFYTLHMKHNGKVWTKQICATQNTPLGQTICHYLEAQGWTYQEGEI